MISFIAIGCNLCVIRTNLCHHAHQFRLLVWERILALVTPGIFEVSVDLLRAAASGYTGGSLPIEKGMKAFQKAKAGGSSSAGHQSSRFAGGTKFGGSPSKGPLKSDSLKTRLLANEAIAHNKRSSDVAIAVDPGLIEGGESFNEPVEEIDIEVSTKPKSMASRFASPNFGANSSKASIQDSNSKAAAKQSSDMAVTIEPNLSTSLDTNVPESPANSGKNTPQKRVSFSDEVSGITGVRSVEMPKPRLGSIKDAAKAAAAAALADVDDDSEREELTMRIAQQAAKASRASLEAAELARRLSLKKR